MAQPLRPDPPGWFHVMNRGARRWDIFIDDDDRAVFIDLLSGLRRRFDARVVSYCLMGNHFHLVLHCPEPALSRSMQWLGSNYTRRFNKRHGYDGPLCRSRFRSVEVLDDPQLVAVVRYVHRNPLDLSPNIDLGAYEWSSHAAYLGRMPTPWWLETDVPLGLFADDRGSFQRTVETAMEFDSVQNRPRASAGEVRAAKMTDEPLIGPRDIRAAVDSVMLRDAAIASWGGKGRPNPNRDVGLLLAIDDFRLDAKEVADAFEFASNASMQRALSRARRKLDRDPALLELRAKARWLLSDEASSSAA